MFFFKVPNSNSNMSFTVSNCVKNISFFVRGNGRRGN